IPKLYACTDNSTSSSDASRILEKYATPCLMDSSGSVIQFTSPHKLSEDCIGSPPLPPDSCIIIAINTSTCSSTSYSSAYFSTSGRCCSTLLEKYYSTKGDFVIRSSTVYKETLTSTINKVTLIIVVGIKIFRTERLIRLFPFPAK